jgi:hypothetical protein
MRPQLPTIRTSTGMANGVPSPLPRPPVGGGPINQGADPFNRPIPVSPLAPQPVSPSARAPLAVRPTMTPAGNVGAAGPVSGASVPVPPPAPEGQKPMATVGTPPAIRPQLR